MKNPLLAVLLAVSLAAAAAFSMVVWTQEPLPTHLLFSDLSLDRVVARGACSPETASGGAVSCPPGSCPVDQGATVDAPVFHLPPEQVYHIARRHLLAEPRLRLISDDPVQRRLIFVQRSEILGLPILAEMSVIPADSPQKSALILRSSSCAGVRASTGHRARVIRWSTDIERAARVGGPPPSGL